MNCMKYKKQQFIGRILSYILAFCMIFIMIPITIYAQSLGQDAISMVKESKLNQIRSWELEKAIIMVIKKHD